jgi:hypothetical protein
MKPGKGVQVPDAFLEVQWTRLAAGDTTPQFVELVRRLVIPVDVGELTRNGRTRAVRGAAAGAGYILAPRAVGPRLRQSRQCLRWA